MLRDAAVKCGFCWFVLPCAVGCGASLSSFRPAHVATPERRQAEFGVDISYPTGTIADVIDAAEVVDELNHQRLLTPDEIRAILDGAAGVGLNPPAIVPHAGIAVSAFRSWEVGARLSTSDWRLNVRKQLLYQHEAGIDLSVGLGVGAAIFDPPIDDAFSVKIDHFGRWNADLPIAFGRHGSWYRWWAGPRLLYSQTAQKMSVVLYDQSELSGEVVADGFYLGGYAGAALGYDSVFVGPELVVVELVGNARIDAFGLRTNVDMSGLVIYPGFAVMGEF